MKKRLAILPFNSSNSSIQFLIPVIQEMLIANLNANNAYVIISKDSINLSVKVDSKLDAIGKQLNADHLVYGNLAEQGEFVFVELKLLSVENRHEKVKEFKVEKNDLFNLGERCLNNLKEILEISQERISETKISKIKNPEIQQLYVLGNYHFNRWTQGNIKLAVEYYKKVIKSEPNYVSAYLKLAKCLIFQAGRGHELPRKVYPEARNYIEKALRVNPDSGEAIIDKNLIDFFYELDWINIYDSIERGLENYVDASEAYQQLSFFWYGLKEYDASLDALYSALEFDPISTGILNMIGDVQLSAKRYEDSEKTFLSILKMVPNDTSSLENIMYIAALQGDERKAISYLKKLNKALPNNSEFTSRMGYVFGKFGLEESAAAYLDYYRKLSIKEPNQVFHNYLAQVFAGKGDWEQTIAHIERGWKARSGILFILTDPQFEPLYKWKRYQRLVSEIKFPRNVEDHNYITLKTDIKETLRVNLKALLYVKAEDNYTRLYLFQNFRIEERLIRATLKTVILQLPEYFRRVHKSYVLNLQHEFKVYGNAKTRYIVLRRHDIEIPVSRSFDVLSLKNI